MSKNLVVGYFVLLAFAFVSCKPLEEKELVNKWRMTDSRNAHRDSIRSIFGTSVEQMEATVDSIKDMNKRKEFRADLNTKRRMLYSNDSLLKIQTDSSFLDFSVNGLYDCNLFGNKETGSWRYDKTKNELITKPAGGGKENGLKILRISSDSLTLGSDANNSMTFYSVH